MLNCQELKEIIQNFKERYSFLEGELLKFKETGEMSEETKEELEKLKKEFNEFEEREIGERVKKLGEEWEKWERGKGIKLPETPHFLLERVLNKFIEGFKEKEYPPFELGRFLSNFINQNIDLYIEKEKEKGKKIEEIKEVVIRLNVKDLKHPLHSLGFSNREKSHLIIQGDGGNALGEKMFGGEIEVHGNCGGYAGMKMSGGKIKVYGNCEIGICYEMSGGRMEVQGNCGMFTGVRMSGGTLIIWGEVEDFDPSTFSSENRGEIWHKGEKIWPK